MRTIDADALIPKLKAILEAENQIYGRVSWGFSAKCLQVIEDASTIEPESQWIPCSERLPEENGQYLITVKYKHVDDSYEDVYAEHGEWSDGRWDMFCFGHCGEVDGIIAWMPLPKPYSPEGEEHEQI